MKSWVLDAFTISGKTESAGTAITAIIPPHPRGVTRITDLVWLNGATAHTVIICKPIAVTTFTAAVAASGTVFPLATSSPGLDSSGSAEALAASDYLAWRATDGIIEYDTVASISGNNVTMNNGTTPGIDANAKCWAFYEVGRTVPHKTLRMVPAVTDPALYPNVFRSIYGVVSSEGRTWEDPDNYASNVSGIDRPLLLYSANATAASELAYLAGVWTKT